MNEHTIQLGKKFNARYVAEGWSAAAAASYCGFHYETLNDLCNGTREFTRAIRAKLAEVFKDPTWLTA